VQLPNGTYIVCDAPSLAQVGKRSVRPDKRKSVRSNDGPPKPLILAQSRRLIFRVELHQNCVVVLNLNVNWYLPCEKDPSYVSRTVRFKGRAASKVDRLSLHRDEAGFASASWANGRLRRLRGWCLPATGCTNSLSGGCLRSCWTSCFFREVSCIADTDTRRCSSAAARVSVDYEAKERHSGSSERWKEYVV
jgi:hypothetical protein